MQGPSLCTQPQSFGCEGEPGGHLESGSNNSPSLVRPEIRQTRRTPERLVFAGLARFEESLRCHRFDVLADRRHSPRVPDS